MPRETVRYSLQGGSFALTIYRINKIQKMSTPVQCKICGGIYDVGKVTVTQRYADCSMWISPCCKHLVDDRSSSHAGIYYLDKETGRIKENSNTW